MRSGRIGGVLRTSVALTAGLLLATAGLPRPVGAQGLPDTVRVREPGLHPEGVEWDAERGRFLVSSVTRGTVSAVRDDGSHRVLVEDSGLAGSIGIHVDRRGGRLLVASADLSVFRDPSARGVAKLGVYDLASGERLLLVDLGGLRSSDRHFGNDVTVAPDGSAYVTDSFAPVIYRVGPEGETEVFLEDPRLTGDGFGLNGIDHHPDGYLLAAVAGRRALVRIPLDDPGSLADVRIPEPFAADGLTLRADGALVAVATTFGAGGEPRSEALLLRSDDGWRSAEIAARAPAPGATTAAVRDGATYAVNPRFGDMGGEEPVDVFEIVRVRLRPGR